MFFNVFFFVIVFNHWQCRIQRNVFSASFCTLCCYCCDNWSSKPPFGLEFHFVSHRNDLKVIHIKSFMIFMDIKIVNGHSAKRFWWLFYPTVWQDGQWQLQWTCHSRSYIYSRVWRLFEFLHFGKIYFWWISWLDILTLIVEDANQN